jgi:hypothetical protein
MITIYEVEYSVSPGGIDMFEMYDGAYDNLVDAHRYCYANGYDYTVKLLSNYSS